MFSKAPAASAFVRSVGRRPWNPALQPASLRRFASVTGTVYNSEDESAPKLVLFTKEGCTLCDKVKNVLMELQADHPHSLEQIDITDDGHEEWFSKYKYDIPVLHLNGKFWIKHRTTIEQASEGLIQAKEGTFEERLGEPDAGAMERKQAEREQLGR